MSTPRITYREVSSNHSHVLNFSKTGHLGKVLALQGEPQDMPLQVAVWLLCALGYDVLWPGMTYKPR